MFRYNYRHAGKLLKQKRHGHGERPKRPEFFNGHLWIRAWRRLPPAGAAVAPDRLQHQAAAGRSLLSLQACAADQFRARYRDRRNGVRRKIRGTKSEIRNKFKGPKRPNSSARPANRKVRRYPDQQPASAWAARSIWRADFHVGPSGQQAQPTWLGLNKGGSSGCCPLVSGGSPKPYSMLQTPCAIPDAPCPARRCWECGGLASQGCAPLAQG
jgi:hypothetical protein